MPGLFDLKPNYSWSCCLNCRKLLGQKAGFLEADSQEPLFERELTWQNWKLVAEREHRTNPGSQGFEVALLGAASHTFPDDDAFNARVGANGALRLSAIAF